MFFGARLEHGDAPVSGVPDLPVRVLAGVYGFYRSLLVVS